MVSNFSFKIRKFVMLIIINQMKIISKIIFSIILIAGICGIAMADRGGFGRKRNKVQLNINMVGPLKKSIPFNLKSGLTFRGSKLLNSQQIGSTWFNTTLVSYKKGNTIYILPYKQKILNPNYSPESGYK